MDGALTHNNPINIAAWESRRLWPEKGHPDFTVSLGTGRPKGIKTYLLGPHSPVKEKFYSRLVTTFMNHLDPEKIWLDFITSVPKEFKSRYIRINVPLDGKYFRLDNLEAFRDLESQAKAFITTNPELERIVPAICASSFYFELDSMPRFIDDEYHCCGHIYCRLNLSDSSNGGRKRLLDTLRKSSARFLVNGQSIPCLISEQEPPPRKRTSKEKKCVSRADSLIDDGRSLLRDDEDCSDFEEQRAELQREDEVVDANAREEEEERRIPLYKRPISFRVPDLDKEIGISVMGQDRSEFFDENGIFHPKYATRMPRHGLHISGFPTSVRKIIAHQGLASRFGHADYRDLGKPLPPLPLKRKHDYYLGRDALLLSRATDF